MQCLFELCLFVEVEVSFGAYGRPLPLTFSHSLTLVNSALILIRKSVFFPNDCAVVNNVVSSAYMMTLNLLHGELYH